MIDGVGGNDVLIGGRGADRLAGGSGADRFLYTSKLDGSDVVRSFESNDVFAFSGSAFGGLHKGVLASGMFVSRAHDLRAHDSTDHYIFRQSDDTLWFDSDGNGAHAAIKIADLSNDFSLKAADILIV
jgi:serralysin